MYTINLKIKKPVPLIILGVLLSTTHTSWAESDKQLQEKALMAREMIHKQTVDHADHVMNAEQDQTGGFRGVFYGYLPCAEKDCDGMKMTLSLKQKNNYLLVTQPAKESSREFYEKGKYNWDDKTRILTLQPKTGSNKHKFSIEDKSTLVQLSSDGTPMPANPKDYTLNRSDTAKSREVHIH